MPSGLDVSRAPTWASDMATQIAAQFSGLTRPVGRTAEQRARRAEERDATRKLHALAALFVRRMEYQFHIPGGHYSGLSNQALYEILAAQGRDFAAPSRALDEHVRLTILSEYEGFTAPPSINALKQTAAMAVLEWVITRWETRVRDVRITPLPQGPGTWFARKKKLGLDLRVGVARGELLEAAREARVKITPNITAADVDAA